MTYAIRRHQCNGPGHQLRQIDRRLRKWSSGIGTRPRPGMCGLDSSVPMASRD